MESVQKIYNFVGKERQNKLVNFEIKTHEGVIYLEHLGNYAVWADVSKFPSLLTLVERGSFIILIIVLFIKFLI